MTPNPHTPESDTLQTDDGQVVPGAPNAPRRSRTTRWVAAAAVAGALLGTTGIAMAQTGDSSAPAPDSTSSSAPAPMDHPDGPPPQHPGEELLTGDTAAKVTAAAQGAVPNATVERVETDAEGSPYEAHMTTSDGTYVTVKVDESYAVITIETDPGGRGPGAPPSGSASASSQTAA